jgi:hypothetical protein
MNVRSWIRYTLIISIFLLVSCSNNPGSPASISDIAKPTATKEQANPGTPQVPPAKTESAPTPQKTGVANCASEEINQIGLSIAESYAFTTVAEVMTWFCDGAEFEDILMALQTEELTGTPAEEMLEMRAEGLSWDDIWLIIGYIEQ